MCSELQHGPFDMPMTDEQRVRIDRMVARAKADHTCTAVTIRTDAAPGVPERVTATLIIPCRAKLAKCAALKGA